MTEQDSGTSPSVDQFEVVGLATRPTKASSRKYVAGFAAAAISVAAVGAGVWAWQAWSEQGAQPAEALPANTLAYVALDFDPPGQQKVEAFSTLRKFPSLKRDLGLDDTDDVTRSVVEEMASDGGCKLNYARDIKPWMGSRMAFAVVGEKRPEPVFVVQAKDVTQAKSGLQAVLRDCHDAGFGFAVQGDWAVLAEKSAVATEVTQSAGRGTLADDKDFKKLTEAAGSPGLATIYAAPEAGPALLDAIDRDPFLGWTATSMLSGAFDPMSTFLSTFGLFALTAPSFGDSGASSAEMPHLSPKQRAAQKKIAKQFEHFDELSPQEQKHLIRQQNKLFEQNGGPSAEVEGSYADEGSMDGQGFTADGPTLSPALHSSLQHFTGLGGVARFDDGALEIEINSDILEGTSSDLYAGSAGGHDVSDLPKSTAIAYGFGLSAKWVDALVARFSEPLMYGGDTGPDPAAAFEKATGLDVPGDLEDLGGDGVALVAGTGFTTDEVSEDPTRAPVAARISGDPDRVEAALDKLRAKLGPEKAAFLQSRRAGDDVVVGPDSEYLDELAHGGDLGDSDRFRKVVPNADDATTALFVDFDAGDWLAKLADHDGERKDAEPLDTFGMTMKKDGDRQTLLARITFD